MRYISAKFSEVMIKSYTVRSFLSVISITMGLFNLKPAADVKSVSSFNCVEFLLMITLSGCTSFRFVIMS
jgi:hypothetical protein